MCEDFDSFGGKERRLLSATIGDSYIEDYLGSEGERKDNNEKGKEKKKVDYFVHLKFSNYLLIMVYSRVPLVQY